MKIEGVMVMYQNVNSLNRNLSLLNPLVFNLNHHKELWTSLQENYQVVVLRLPRFGGCSTNGAMAWSKTELWVIPCRSVKM